MFMKKYVVLLLRFVLRMFYAAKLYFVTSKSSEDQRHQTVTVLLCPSFPRGMMRYLISDTIIKDMATISYLNRRGFNVRLKLGPKIGGLANSIIVANYSKDFNLFSFWDHSSVFPYIYNQLESQHNIVLPHLSERMLWENKEHMHRVFKERGVNEPATHIYKNREELINNPPLSYPFLIKEEHSSSSVGVHKISCLQDLRELVDDRYMVRNNNVIVQELVNMRKDLRVILVAGKVVLSYWRINPKKEWSPTATAFGSYVKFGDFPEAWRQHIVDTFNKLEIVTGAFDITWQNDDLTTEPLYLEVSTNYQPNPEVDVSQLGCTYGEYKKQIRIVNSYDKHMVATLYRIQQAYVGALVDTYLSNLDSV